MALLLQDTLLDNSSTCVSDVATTCIWVLFAVFAGVHHVLSAVIGREFSLHETCREFIQRYRQREVDSQALPMLASACPGLVVIILIRPRRMHSIDVVCCYIWSTVVCLSRPWVLHIWLNLSRSNLGADSCGPKEPCIRWLCTSVPPGKYDRMTWVAVAIQSVAAITVAPITLLNMLSGCAVCRMDLLRRENAWFIHFAAHINNKVSAASYGFFSQVLPSCISGTWCCSDTRPSVSRDSDALLW